MTYRSMKKTDSDKMKDIDQKKPENAQFQSVETNAINDSAIIAKEKGKYHRDPNSPYYPHATH